MSRFTSCDAAGAGVAPGTAGAAPPAPAGACAPATLAELPALCAGFCALALGDAERGEVGRMDAEEVVCESLRGAEVERVGR